MDIPAADIVIIDADTIKVGRDRYRLLGFDAPETYSAKCNGERVLGFKAAARLGELIASGRVVLEPNGERDRYKRLLARLTVDGKDVGAILIGEGLSVPYDGQEPRKDWCGG